MLEWDHYEYKIAEYYLPILINDDASGMEDEEIKEFHLWRMHQEELAEEQGFDVGHWTDLDGSGEDWGACAVSGLFAMRCTVRLMVYRRE
jgi:hypothetical protein